jgi:hypothetical protein
MLLRFLFALLRLISSMTAVTQKITAGSEIERIKICIDKYSFVKMRVMLLG